MILLDTNAVIHFIKGMEGVVQRVKAAPNRELAIAAITRYELEVGLLQIGTPAAKRMIVHELCRDLHQVPFDEGAAIQAAQIRSELAAKGQLIRPLDLLIAGTARNCGALLVTGNMREFSRVRGLRCENWSTSDERRT